MALYLFSEDESLKAKFLTEVSLCGVGQSGIGHYHGKNSFDEFTHKKTIIEKG
ncbi:hypothetical protein ACVNNN_19875 [Lysinibacillus fusiformis]|uniref:hypothetical protein n=1 Tax=Lysinibacillus sp. PWR01 TaxID=3342384 RepID=UPI00372D0EF9